MTSAAAHIDAPETESNYFDGGQDYFHAKILSFLSRSQNLGSYLKSQTDIFTRVS
jgi:hypothetical protein